MAGRNWSKVNRADRMRPHGTEELDRRRLLPPIQERRRDLLRGPVQSRVSLLGRPVAQAREARSRRLGLAAREQMSPPKRVPLDNHTGGADGPFRWTPLVGR